MGRKLTPFEKTITHVSQSPTDDYLKRIKRAKTKEGLVKAITYYRALAADAHAVAKSLTDEEFKQWKIDVKKVKDEQSEEWIKNFMVKFGFILMPSLMLKLDMIKHNNPAAPWGTVFKRFCDIYDIDIIIAEVGKAALAGEPLIPVYERALRKEFASLAN